MGDLKYTTFTLEMLIVKYPLGILEDVPVRVGKIFILMEFFILDMAEDTQTLIILGRPFLHTARAVIDVKSGKLTLTMGDDKVIFSLTNTPKSLMLEELCYSVDVIDEPIHDCMPHSPSHDTSDDVLILESIAREEHFLTVLKTHKKAIGYDTDNLTGLSHAFNEHRTHLDEATTLAL